MFDTITITEDESRKIDAVVEALTQNDRNYDLLKLAEECTELSEVCIKKITKEGGVKEPADGLLIEEMGDVLLRLITVSDRFDPDGTLVPTRIKEKFLHLFERIEKYKGRL
jgi:NTP pyrophosphatase (non-canonical NTP hydrolase)